MSKKNVSYPHPVLGVSDDVYPLLHEGCVELQIKDRKPLDFVFIIKLIQENETITQLIEDGKAEYACELECKDTFLRRCYRSSSPTIEMVVGRKELCGHITFNCFVALKEPLHGYANPDFNDDYQDYTFDLEEGDLLVLFPGVSHNVDIRYDKLYAAGTYMQITEGRRDLERPWFSLANDKINIELPQDMFRQYQQFANTQYIEFIHASLVYNALVYALREMTESPEEFERYLWYSCLEARISSDDHLKRIDMTNLQGIYEAADIILGNPYKRMFDKLQQI